MEDALTSSPQKIDVEVAAETEKAKHDILSVEDTANNVDAEIPVDADTKHADSEIDAFEKETENRDTEIPVDADTEPAKKMMNAFADDLRALSERVKGDPIGEAFLQSNHRHIEWKHGVFIRGRLAARSQPECPYTPHREPCA